MIKLTPESPNVRWWKDQLQDADVSELSAVVEGDPDAVDASHYYAAEVLLDELEAR